jgi:hypothetical protein
MRSTSRGASFDILLQRIVRHEPRLGEQELGGGGGGTWGSALGAGSGESERRSGLASSNRLSARSASILSTRFRSGSVARRSPRCDADAAFVSNSLRSAGSSRSNRSSVASAQSRRAVRSLAEDVLVCWTCSTITVARSLASPVSTALRAASNADVAAASCPDEVSALPAPRAQSPIAG